MQRLLRRHEEAGRSYEERPPLFVLLGALLLYFVRFGYDYGNSDQDEVIPYLLHRLDAGLFTQDWFVSIQVSEFSVRTYFVWLINAFALFLPVWISVLILYVAAWLFIAAAVYKLAYHFTSDQGAACLAVVVALVFTPVWTLGGNDLVHSMLVASMVSWALGLWAIYFFLQARYLLAPVLLGMACWIQALVGLHLALLLFLVRVTKRARGERGTHTIGGILAFGFLFVLWASPALGPIAYQQLFAQPEFRPEPSLFYILAEFRLPHHYLPASFHVHNVLRFGILTLLSVGALLWKPFRVRLRDSGLLVRLLIFVGLFCLVATVLTEFVPVLPVAKLQLFKMTVLAKLLFVIVLSGSVFYWMPRRLARILRSAIRHPGWGLTLVALAWIAVLSAAVLGEGYLHDNIRPFQRAEQPIGQVQDWARRNTSYGAIFAVPPSLSSFRSEAHRTIVVNYKSIPYEDEEMVVWFRRLRDMAPLELPERGGPDLPGRLDRAYEANDAARLAQLANIYRFDYVLRTTDLENAEPYFEEVFRAGDWVVYALSRNE